MENLSQLHEQLQHDWNHDYTVAPPEWQRKGALIQDISTIQISLGKSPVNVDQFEMLIEMSVDQLARIVNDQASQLERAKLGL